MSKKLYGNAKFPITNLNKGVQVIDVDANIPSYLNRKTESQTIKKYISCAGGFHRGLWQPPLVAELPDGRRLLFDGDHRRQLWIMAFPNKKKMPVQVIKVNSLQEISKLFVIINKEGRKNLASDEVFVHEVHSGDQTAIKDSQNLTKSGLCVSLGTGEQGSSVGATSGLHNSTAWRVKINGFRNTVQKTGLDPVIDASSLIQKTWTDENMVQNELLGGLAHVFKNTGVHSDKSISSAFESFIGAMATARGKQRNVASDFKQRGGSVVNMHEESVALGIIESFYQSPQRSNISKNKMSSCFSGYRKRLKRKLNQ
jgi:hypothetical protein